MSAGRASLLVVEDDQVDRQRARRLLGDEYEVVEASTGGEALVLVESRTFDCALVDYRLPDLDGLEVLEELAARSVPVVMLTGQGDEETAVRAMQAGAKDYIAKDRITRESLGQAVWRAIESGRLEGRIAEARRDLEDFVAVVAHDVRSPVATIISLTESVLETAKDRLGDTERRFLRSCVGVGEDLCLLVERLGEYTHTGRGDSDFTEVDLGEVASSVVGRLTESIRQAEATVEFADLPTVRGSRAGLSQLLQNLVSNSLKFCEGRRPRVEITAREEPGECVVSVRDNGIGVPEAERRSIFAPLKRLHARERFRGSGLGLAICSRIVEQHGGRVWVEPARGGGSVFSFSLPRQD